MGETTDTPSNTMRNGVVDLLGLGPDYKHVSPARRALMHGSQDSRNAAVKISLIDDEPMEVEMHDIQVDPTLARQAHPNDANRFPVEQARSTLDLSNTTRRPLRAHHNRRNNLRNSSRYPQDGYYTPIGTVYRDLDDDRGRAYPYDCLTREPSPEILRNRGEAIFVSNMADHDVKEERDDRRDGDRYRGGGHNKRRRDGEHATRQLEASGMLTQADGDDNYNRDRGRGPQRRRNDDGPPRRRYEEPPFPKLRRLLLNIASSTKLPQDEAIEIAKYFGEHFDDERLRSDFFDVWVQLLIEQPFKIPFVAAVALYGNEVKPEIAIEAMKRVGERAQQALNAGEWKEFKQLLRFFACLQPLFEDDGVFTILGQLFDTVVDLQSANENDVRHCALFHIQFANVSRLLVSSLSRSSSSPFLTR
jgi:hypothetical protein